MYTKIQMVEIAHEAGYAKVNADLFTNWRTWGLLGRPTSKASRRGGESLWDNNQKGLWLALLQQRYGPNPIRIHTLLNIPVACWSLGFPGVGTPQAQRAWDQWLQRSETEPTGPRSLRQRAIEDAVEDIAAPEVRPKDRRALRDIFGQMADSAPDMTVQRSRFVEVVLPVIAPGSAPHPSLAGFAAARFNHAEIQSFAMKYRRTLLQTTPDVLAFWEWVREFIQVTMWKYEVDLPKLRANPHTRRFFGDPSVQEHANNACARLLLAFGIGLRATFEHRTLPGEDVPQPPRLALRHRGPSH